MKTVIITLASLTLFFVTGLSGTGLAAGRTTFWSRMCASCHDGKTAPDAVLLKKKYPTVKEFETAVKNKGNRCMNILKNDEKLARKVAKELGIKG